MMDFNERVIPQVSANFLYQEALARYDFAKRFLDKGMYVLDVGCGTGYGSAHLSKSARVTGLDSSREAIKYAKNHYGRKVKFILGNAEKLKLADGVFNVVCAFEVIEHLRNPKRFLSEAKRVLEKKGRFILSTPNRNFISAYGRSISPYHIKEYNFRELEGILKRYFSEVEIMGQRKSQKALLAFDDFMVSQKTRQGLVNSDILGLRKLFPRSLKEKLWKCVGNFFGRETQELLKLDDFPIVQRGVEEAEYFIGVCQK